MTKSNQIEVLKARIEELSIAPDQLWAQREISLIRKQISKLNGNIVVESHVTAKVVR